MTFIGLNSWQKQENERSISWRAEIKAFSVKKNQDQWPEPNRLGIGGFLGVKENNVLPLNTVYPAIRII